MSAVQTTPEFEDRRMSMKTSIGIRKFLFLFGALLVGLAAWMAYDSWLRTVSLIASWAMVTLILWGLVIFSRSKWLKMVAASILVIFELAAPIASFQRVLVIQDATDGDLFVQVRHRADSRRHKEKRLLPGKSWRFVYFTGDSGRITNIPVTIQVTRVKDQSTKSIDFDLPVATNPPPLTVHGDWLAK